ncbi:MULTISPECIES: nitrile hydratase subunit alpha [Paraburkholderia]|jgi:nitrile hydratase|uniref:nitrile hydratase n=1 Tax=Paraburkholderia largidicola TaxID=3014751 RepID=A0A7I8BTB4_9BURK|nr:MULTISPECIES: nitrile hydratase subunit alpha [Paraburkholderia]BEU25360.1 nitrile hydratase subunit alpha [Paraburkholderia sp. 22B1P]GJH35148.1 nitrile hydratase subunit alpha [Paraburkholderia hospita]CAG9263499.1 Low-molecular weight cobalt-containing nitrile hydratase subunit alpha [Paraburkholderia caribensis]BCF91559.1 nitrile hydratase subunit alpha [Paraburkholderia sp. PGU16]GJH02607.1 nitrile hydratase subunit alpha [Paraburkholderia terrae]
MTPMFEYPEDREASSAAKVRALEALLIEKGVIGSDSVDAVLAHFETMAGPFNGAKIVAHAWVDPAYKQRLVEDTPKAIAELSLPLGMAGAEGEHMAAVANDSNVHNLIICTLCSCYPWPVLGLPPYWYKDPVFRARGVREPRAVLQEFGVTVPAEKEVKVWDSSAQIRWFVVPERPANTEHLSEEELAALVTPESMMGVALVAAPAA